MHQFLLILSAHTEPSIPIVECGQSVRVPVVVVAENMTAAKELAANIGSLCNGEVVSVTYLAEIKAF